MLIRIYLLLLMGLGALMLPGCSDDVDAPINDRFTRSKETPAQSTFVPYPTCRRTDEVETDTDADADADADSDSDTCTGPDVAPGY